MSVSPVFTDKVEMFHAKIGQRDNSCFKSDHVEGHHCKCGEMLCKNMDLDMGGGKVHRATICNLAEGRRS